jgi:AmmeMemoRadiSam system protein B
MLIISLFTSLVVAQAAIKPPSTTPPTLEEIRKGMGIASHDDVRGQQDAVGFASTAEQMARVWDLSMSPPPPESFGPVPKPGVAGILSPHDDYLYAGRVYRKVIPLVTARTVVVVGVFHRYRRFGAHDRVVFDSYRAWRTPDGDVPVSPLRQELLAAMPADEVVQDAASHDSEHSIEAIVYWLAHQRKDLEIVPIIVPAAPFERLESIAGHLGQALADAMKKRKWGLGLDVAVVISSDGIHYGRDFDYTPFGEGGVEAYGAALKQDRLLLTGPLSDELSAASARAFYAKVVDPASPDTYRMPWCGRFSIPFGLLLLGATAHDLGLAPPRGVPVALASTVGVPELPVKALGMGATAPANLYHFVTAPGVAFVLSGN